jgi:D-glycero-alpha-D-manno-heptose 1-phosphate guanylyltransferase
MQGLSEITTAILAGGLGTRLRSVIADRPKVLAEVQRRPFLEYLLDQLSATKLRDVVLCTGHMGEQIRKKLGETYGPLRLFYSQEPSPLGTGGALRFALPMLTSDPVLVMNGDSFCSADLRSFWRWHGAQGAKVSLLLTYQPDTQRYGRVHLQPDGRILRFSEKDAQNGPGWMNGGIYLIQRSLLQAIPEGRAISLERNLFPSWVDRGLYGYCNGDRFLDIGIPEAYDAADQFFTKGGLP